MSTPVAASFALHDAASHGNEKDVSFLLATGKFEVDSKDADGFTPFALAAIYGHVDAMSALLEARADPHQDFSIKQILSLHPRWFIADQDKLWPTVEQTTAALLACYLGDLAMLELVLRYGVSANHTFNELTLLTAAAASRSKQAKDLVSLLLQHGATADEESVFGTVALHWACLRDDPDVARLLLEADEGGASVEAVEPNGGITPLHLASERSVCPGLVELLLEFKADVNAEDFDGLTPIMNATCSKGKDAMAIVELLAKRDGADLDAKARRRFCALSGAASRGNAAMVKLLLELGASPSDNDALYTACTRMHPEVVKLLLDAGAVADDVPVGVWMEAPLEATLNCFSDSDNDKDEKIKSVFQLLVAHGADVDRKDFLGRTYLHALCQFGDLSKALKATQLLLQAGADVNATDENGETPLRALNQRTIPAEQEHIRQTIRELLERA